MKTRVLTALLLTFAAPAFAGEAITVYRDPGCGCCDSYIEYLKTNGFEVTIVDDTKFTDRIESTWPERQQAVQRALTAAAVKSMP